MRDTLYAKAQVEYQKAIEADNTNAIAHYNMGNTITSRATSQTYSTNQKQTKEVLNNLLFCAIINLDYLRI